MQTVGVCPQAPGERIGTSPEPCQVWNLKEKQMGRPLSGKRSGRLVFAAQSAVWKSCWHMKEQFLVGFDKIAQGRLISAYCSVQLNGSSNIQSDMWA